MDTSIRERLAEIAGDDAEFIAELIDAFITCGADALLEMRAAAHRNERDALARAIHTLKGASANMHINELAALTLNLEAQTQAGTQNDWAAEIARISAEFERVTTEMKAACGAGVQRKAG